MTKLDYFLICELANQDERRRPTLVNIYNDIEVMKFPARPIRFTLAFSFLPDEAFTSLILKLDIVDPDGVVLANAQGDAVLTEVPELTDDSDITPEVSGALDMGTRFRLTRDGTHKARLFANDKLLAERPFEVTLRVREEKS